MNALSFDRVVFAGRYTRVLEREPRHLADEPTYWVQIRNTPIAETWQDRFPATMQRYQEPFYEQATAVDYARHMEQVLGTETTIKAGDK